MSNFQVMPTDRTGATSLSTMKTWKEKQENKKGERTIDQEILRRWGFCGTKIQIQQTGVRHWQPGEGGKDWEQVHTLQKSAVSH